MEIPLESCRYWNVMSRLDSCTHISFISIGLAEELRQAGIQPGKVNSYCKEGIIPSTRIRATCVGDETTWILSCCDTSCRVRSFPASVTRPCAAHKKRSLKIAVNRTNSIWQLGYMDNAPALFLDTIWGGSMLHPMNRRQAYFQNFLVASTDLICVGKRWSGQFVTTK